MDGSPSDFESGLVDLRGMSLEQLASSDDSALADSVERLLLEASRPGQTRSSFQSSI